MTFTSIFSTFNLSVIAAIVAVVLIVMGANKSFSSKSTKKNANIGIVVLVGVFLFGALGNVAVLTNPVQDIFSGSQTLAIGDTSTQGGFSDDKLCAVEDTTVTLLAQDKYNAVATGGTHRYRVSTNGGSSFAPARTVADAGTFTASPGNFLQILWNNESKTGAYGQVQEVVVPCKGTVDFFADTVTNGTLTIRTFNEEGNVIDGGAENETLAQGDVINLDFEVQGQFETDFPYGFILVAEYNKTTMADIDIVIEGVTLDQTAVPTVFSPVLGAESSRKAFIFPPVISNIKLEGTITLDADDNNNPGVFGSDVLLTAFPLDFFINNDEGGAFEGPAAEDENDVAVRTGQITSTLHVD